MCLSFFGIVGPEKPGPLFTPINKRLWPYWDRFFTFAIAWQSVSTYPDGRAQLTVGVPHVIGTWIVSAFSISQQTGLSVLPSVLMVSVRLFSPDDHCGKCVNQFEGTRRFFIAVEVPGTARLGEQIGVRVDVFNFQAQRIEVRAESIIMCMLKSFRRL